MTTPLHVVLGAGQVGARLATRLLKAGHRVRTVRQRGVDATDGLHETLTGDLTDLSFAERAGRGATVIYECLNPPYWEWHRLLLPLGRGALHAATSAGARLVALENLYPYGAPGHPITEDTPFAPCSRKGELRVRLHEQRMAHRDRIAIGRASDFFGPALPSSWWSQRFLDHVFAGKKGECPGDPDLPHAYTFVDDIAAALEVMGARDDAFGHTWMLPTAPAWSTRAITRALGAALGLEADSAKVPRLVLKALGLFNPLIRETVEMAYQWDVPFTLDDARFVQTFGLRATPLEAAIAQTAKVLRG